jgi:peptide chain release factor 1
LADNDVVSDKEQCQKLSKELSSLEDSVKKYKEYKKLLAEIDDTVKLLEKDPDPELVEMAEKELEHLKERKAELTAVLEELILEEDPDAAKDVIMEIRAGTGGREAALFASDLFRMYSKYAVRQGWKIEVMDSHIAEGGGFKEIIVTVKGKNVYKHLKYEKGVHRVQRVPVTEASGRIHTSAVTVAVLPEAEDVEVDVNPQDLKIDTYRSSGAGGQHVNVTDSAVRITHLPTGIVVQCQNERSQYKNKASAMRVLKARILEGMRMEHDKKISNDRKKQVGSGDRSEKIRTYNFPDRRLTDHRIGFTIHKLDRIMEGELDEVVFALITAERKLKLGEK